MATITRCAYCGQAIEPAEDADDPTVIPWVHVSTGSPFAGYSADRHEAQPGGAR